MPNNNMTIKEAIIELNRCKVSGYMPTDWDRRCRAIEAAKAALEKQMPKKPEAESRYYGVGRCPNCRAVFRDASTNFCGNCGQALDWGDV